MGWRLGLGVLLVITVLAVAAVIFALSSAKGPHGADRVKEAIRWPTTCGSIVVERPSRASIMQSWSASAEQTADIRCGRRGPGVAFAQFRDNVALNGAVAGHQPAQAYCLFGSSIVLDELREINSSAFTDMCQTLSGTFVSNVG
jgi:hypothetical protein